MTQEAAVPAGYLEQVRRIAREEVAAAYRSGSLRNASIGEGGTFTIRGGRLQVLYPATQGGGLSAYVGDLYDASDGSYLGSGLLVQDQDGQPIAQFRSDAPSGQSRALITDASGETAVSTDAAGGLGLARPYLSNSFVPSRYADWTISTSSATFETLFVSSGYRTHAGILAWTRASMDTSGSTGEVRVLVNSAQLDTPGTIGFAQTLSFHGPTILPGESYDFLTVEIQGRVASGAGSLRVAGGGWIGRP